MGDRFYYKDTAGKEHNIYTKQPYVCDNGTKYEAHGQSIDENEVTWDFILVWDVLNPESLLDETDEANACDWDKYTVEELGVAL